MKSFEKKEKYLFISPIRLSIFALILVSFVACKSGEKMQSELSVSYSSTPQTFDLSPDERRLMERKANVGDVDAALRLNEYFALSVGEPDKGVPYLRMAVEKGNRRAMWILASHLVNSESGGNCEALALYENLSRIEIEEVERNDAKRTWLTLQAKLGTCP